MRSLRPSVKEIANTFFADLTRANDSQACWESAEQVWADSSQPVKFSHFGALRTHALPRFSVEEILALFLPI